MLNKDAVLSNKDQKILAKLQGANKLNNPQKILKLGKEKPKSGPLKAYLNQCVGLAALELDKKELAEKHFRITAEFAQSDERITAWLNLATSLNLQHKYEEGEGFYLRALQLDRNSMAALHSLLSMYERSDQHHKASLLLETYKGEDLAWVVEGFNGVIALKEGRLDDAHRLLHAAVFNEANVKPEFLPSYTKITRFNADNSEALIAKIKHAINNHGLNDKDKAQALFALGKIYDDLGDAKNAAMYLHQANLLKAKSRPFDSQQFAQNLQLLRERFNEIKGQLQSVDSSISPILITGCPRSGSTLLEQHFAKIDAVASGGELSFLPDAILKQAGGKYSTSLEAALSLDAQQWQRVANDYCHALTDLCDEQHSHVVDKQLNNFYFLPFIQELLPNAVLLDSHRYKYDIALSCYMSNFNHGLNFSFNFQKTCDYYECYIEHIQWCKEQGVKVLTADYGQMVSEHEKTAKQIIEHAKLPWHDDILNFHTAKTSVSTASQAQVREKLYTRSLNRWQAYKPYFSKQS